MDPFLSGHNSQSSSSKVSFSVYTWSSSAQHWMCMNANKCTKARGGRDSGAKSAWCSFRDPGSTPSTLMPAHSCLQLQSQGTWLLLLASRYQEYMWYIDIYESKTLINIKWIKVNQTVVISVKIVQTVYTDLKRGRIWCQSKVGLLTLHSSGSFHCL